MHSLKIYLLFWPSLPLVQIFYVMLFYHKIHSLLASEFSIIAHDSSENLLIFQYGLWSNLCFCFMAAVERFVATLEIQLFSFKYSFFEIYK